MLVPSNIVAGRVQDPRSSLQSFTDLLWVQNDRTTSHTFMIQTSIPEFLQYYSPYHLVPEAAYGALHISSNTKQSVAVLAKC